MIFDELKRSFRRNQWYSLCAFILMVLSLLLTMVALSEFSRVKDRSDFAKELSDKNYYRLMDNYAGEEEALFFQQQDNVTRLKELYQKLKSTSAFQYLSMVSQPIYVKNLAVSDQFLDGYEHNAIQKGIRFSETDTGYSAFTSIQLEWEAITYFKLTLPESNKELLKQWDTPDLARIPVLLGSEYRGVVPLGDTFSINYLGLSAKIEVAGFLAPGSSLVHKGDMASLNRCILFPALQLGNPATAAEKEIQMRIYLQKLSGTIVSGQTPDEVQKIVTDLCTQCDLQPFNVEGARGTMELF